MKSLLESPSSHLAGLSASPGREGKTLNADRRAGIDGTPPQLAGNTSGPRSIYGATPFPTIMHSTRSFDRRNILCGKRSAIVFLLFQSQAALAQLQHDLPLVMSASNLSQQGFVRIINRSERAGTVSVHAIDDAGERFGPVSLSLDVKEARQFSSRDLEEGNASRGLSGGVGDGHGNWRLELDTDLEIEPLAYVRTEGLLSSMHEVAPEEAPGRYRVPTFNPGSNRSRQSFLRLVNPGEHDAEVAIEGLDARGNQPPGGEVRLTLPAGTARRLSAQQLEEGGSGFEGRFGDGEGKWGLSVSADRSIHVMSLLEGPRRNLTNLSRGAPSGERTLPLVMSASNLSQQGFVRIINRSERAGTVSVHAIDDAGERFGPVSLSLDVKEARQFNSRDLEEGNASRGLSGGVGDGHGNWRLELDTDLEIEPLAYIRTEGLLSSMHEVAPEEAPGRYRVPTFNPGSNRSRQSFLRLINPGEHDTEVVIEGLDARGNPPPGGEVRLTLPAGTARMLSAQQLEEGGSGFEGRFGDGEGKWGLWVSADRSIHVMSLLQSSTGGITNLSTSPAVRATSYRGRVTGHDGPFENVEVLLSSGETLRTTRPDSTGRFAFHDLAAGEYAIKVRASGYKAPPARVARIPARGDGEPFELERLVTDPFVFHWEEDHSIAGHDYAAHVNQPPRIEFLGEPVDVADDSSSERLRHDYNVLLVDSDGGSWSQEHAYRLLETMKAVPQERRDAYAGQTRPPSRWLLSTEYIEHDIEIIRHDDGSRSVLVSQAAFVNASPRVASVDGKRGIWFSQRLHHAVVRWVTDNGQDEAAYEKILKDRFGLTTQVDDYYALTAPTGHETAARFQPFHAEEMVQIINMLEEMPRGMHKVPGFHTLIRRLDGTPHPLYPEAPAVAWPEQGYVEFMDSAFLSGSVQHMHRLIIHEKAHFLWAHLFDDRLKEDWSGLGGWYRDASSPSGWYTTRQTEFVSAYAHAKNPDEDMAESFAFFIVNPDKLKSRAIDKYEFVRDRIMQGDIYLSQIREDLTFEVYNLFPDYVFPGKIRRVDIRVEGAAQADKTVSVELELHALDVPESQTETCQRPSAGHCTWARTRVFSDAGTYFDIYLHPPDEPGESPSQGVVLRGSHVLSRYAKAGYWLPGQIEIQDAAGNQRFERANDFGWKLYVNNPLEDIASPEYVAGTAALRLEDSVVDNRAVQVIQATWVVEEEFAMHHPEACYASMNDEIPETYRIQEYGDYDPTTGLCHVDFVMPDYMPSSTYSLDHIAMWDEARNNRRVYFTGDFSGGEQHEAPRRIEVVTANPDAEPPTVAINRIEIDAQPTKPEAPNGETVVTVRFRVRDDVSGFTHAALNFRDPQGIEHFKWVHADDGYELFASDDPTTWKWHTFTHVLPPGSAPGIWGLADMTVYDRAGYFREYDFTEIIHFEVD